MRKIKIETWKSKVPKYAEDGITMVGTTEKEEDLLTALNVLIASKKPEDMPRGLDKFRLFGRISKAFDEADVSKVLELEEADYSFLKDYQQLCVPSPFDL
ncbi:hypothetical protein LCGC14_1547040 [marine sediment metagenome]|uniref:Uncharacterized protein n=1 Tax=marine sediment metagenome TaxID=412755 RepID=A0A0F9JCB0_9ZZZZ